MGEPLIEKQTYKNNKSIKINNIFQYIHSILSYWCVIFTLIVLFFLFCMHWAATSNCDKMEEDFVMMLPHGISILIVCDKKGRTEPSEPTKHLDWNLDNFKFHAQR